LNREFVDIFTSSSLHRFYQLNQSDNSLVDEITHKIVAEAGSNAPTSSSILGPFWVPDAPFRELGDSIVRSPHNGKVSLMHGRITDSITNRGIPNAVFDIWQASSNGKYDFQDPENQEPNNLRGKFRTDHNGRYYCYILRPTAYSLPTDGPAGVLLKLLDRHAFRPAHIHLMISHPDYRPLTTQLYPRDDPYLSTDTVFAVKEDLVVDFKPLRGDKKAELELEYNVRLAPLKPSHTARL
jgi:catechol 1,2-dioxygenase